MKKLVLLLVISLGLSVANAESVCENMNKFIGVNAEWFASALGNANNNSKNRDRKIINSWKNRLERAYIGEIKHSDKESLCLYMTTAITDYLKTTLTPQDIERFERYLTKKNLYVRDCQYIYGRCVGYESNKDKYLNALKFLKYFDKIEYWYSSGKDTSAYEGGDTGSLADAVNAVTNYSGEVQVRRFVYGKDMGDYLHFQNNDFYGHDYTFSTMNNIWTGKNCPYQGNYCNEIKKDLKPIIKWAESKINESKQKEAK